MHFQNMLTTANIWQTDKHLTIKTPRTQQRRIQYVRTVGSGNDDNALVALEAVHLDQQLVERLLALVVATAEPGAFFSPTRSINAASSWRSPS